MPEQIRISAKNLGALALPAHCPRCAWLTLRLRHKAPFQIFPGIFSSIDSYTKRVVHSRFDEHGGRPRWLTELGDIVGYGEPPHWSHFNLHDRAHNVLLTGMPDALLIRADGSFVIGDYKTAKYTGTQDELLPMYEVQLNAYALIAERRGFHPVSGLALIYMEPMTDPADARGRYRDYGFEMGFSAHVLSVQLAPDLINPLLARVREIHDMPTSPPGRPGCKDCQLVDRLVSLACEPLPDGVAPRN
jgi:hypothetical protein